MKQYKILFLLATTICSILPALLSAQVDTTWTRRYVGPANDGDIINAMVIDNLGNVYVTGYSEGVNTLYDYCTIKYYVNGNVAWIKRFDGPGNDYDNANTIAVDNLGNVYVTGSSKSSSAVSSYDYLTIKYNSSGDTVWTRRYNGPGNNNDFAYAVAVDSSGNVYVAGLSAGSGTNDDFATIKYNSAGVQEWVSRYNGPGNNGDAAYSMKLDRQGNIYVTGASIGSGTNWDYATIKYYPNGDTAWVRRYNGTGNSADEAYMVAVDGSGKVYVTGYTNNASSGYDYTTIKYNALGDTLWVRKYAYSGNSQDYAEALALDSHGNVYVTGYSSVTGGTNFDYATLKYDSLGNEIWSRRYNGTANAGDYGYALAIDAQDNVYVTGASYNSIIYSDIVTIKYDPLGNTIWSTTYDGLYHKDDWPCAIALYNTANIYVAGVSCDSTDLENYITIKYVQGQGVEENRQPLAADRLTLEVFPNPAKTYFTVRLPQTTDHSMIKIFNVSGKIVKSEELKGNNNRISLDGIMNGVYFVQLDNQTISKKLVITK